MIWEQTGVVSYFRRNPPVTYGNYKLNECLIVQDSWRSIVSGRWARLSIGVKGL